MADGRFVAYYRVSTDRQGRSGLGLDAQREAVEAYLNGGRRKIIADFTEVESGKSSDRPALSAALDKARLHRVPLIVAKVDRLTRSLAFLSKLLEAGVDVRFCDLPSIEGPAGRFMLQQMAAVAELEAGMISARTKAALARSTKKLGGYRGKPMKPGVPSMGTAALQARARARGADLAPTIEQLRKEGVTSLGGLAKALSERGIPTARGGTTWSAMQVKRVMAAAAN